MRKYYLFAYKFDEASDDYIFIEESFEMLIPLYDRLKILIKEGYNEDNTTIIYGEKVTIEAEHLYDVEIEEAERKLEELRKKHNPIVSFKLHNPLAPKNEK